MGGGGEPFGAFGAHLIDADSSLPRPLFAADTLAGLDEALARPALAHPAAGPVVLARVLAAAVVGAAREDLCTALAVARVALHALARVCAGARRLAHTVL